MKMECNTALANHYKGKMKRNPANVKINVYTAIEMTWPRILTNDDWTYPIRYEMNDNDNFPKNGVRELNKLLDATNRKQNDLPRWALWDANDNYVNEWTFLSEYIPAAVDMLRANGEHESVTAINELYGYIRDWYARHRNGEFKHMYDSDGDYIERDDCIFDYGYARD